MRPLAYGGGRDAGNRRTVSMKGTTDMTDVRLMDTKEDFVKLGINPDKVEQWEDGRRDTSARGHWEWWYFDAILDDGSSVVVQFFPKDNMRTKESVDSPHLTARVVTKDGRTYEKHPAFRPEQCRFAKEACDVRLGSNLFQGDLETYRILVDSSDDGFGVDITLKSQSKPYRPGTSYFEFGDDYYTWLCVVPRGEVTGTVTLDGVPHEVHGRGYHDHQWGSALFWSLWNNWLWARHNFEDHSLLVFDMVASKKYGYQRFPIAFLQDKDGNIVFENTKDVNYQLIEKYRDTDSGKYYPRRSKYTFDVNGKHIEYELEERKVLESQNAKARKMPAPAVLMLKLKGLDPSYVRYEATGDLTVTEGGKETLHRDGALIYEFMYPGTEDFSKHV